MVFPYNRIYLAIKGNESLIHGKTWMGLENILSENASHTHIYMKCQELANLWRQKQISGCFGLGVRRMGGITNGSEQSTWGDEMFYNYIMMMVAQLCIHTKKQ